MQIHKYPKHLPYINYRMLHKRVVCVYLEGIIIRLTAQLLRCELYMCVRKRGNLFFKITLVRANHKRPRQPQASRDSENLQVCVCSAVSGGEVSPPINKTLSKGFRRKEIISQMVTFAHPLRQFTVALFPLLIYVYQRVQLCYP